MGYLYYYRCFRKMDLFLLISHEIPRIITSHDSFEDLQSLFQSSYQRLKIWIAFAYCKIVKIRGILQNSKKRDIALPLTGRDDQ